MISTTGLIRLQTCSFGNSRCSAAGVGSVALPGNGLSEAWPNAAHVRKNRWFYRCPGSLRVILLTRKNNLITRPCSTLANRASNSPIPRDSALVPVFEGWYEHHVCSAEIKKAQGEGANAQQLADKAEGAGAGAGDG